MGQPIQTETTMWKILVGIKSMLGLSAENPKTPHSGSVSVGPISSLGMTLARVRIPPPLFMPNPPAMFSVIKKGWFYTYGYDEAAIKKAYGDDVTFVYHDCIAFVKKHETNGFKGFSCSECGSLIEVNDKT